MMDKKKGMILLGGGIIVLVVAILFFVFTGQSQSDILKDFYAKIEEKDYQGMYDLLSSQSQKEYDQNTFIERNQKIYEGIEAKNIKVENIQEDGDVLSYKVTMDSLAGTIEYTYTTTFQDNKINWVDAMIYPTLQSSYKVRIKEQKAVRGEIVDCHGVVLAGQGEAYQVGLVKGKLNQEQDYDEIASLLSITKESIQKSMSASWVKDDSFVPLKLIEKSNITLKNKLLQIPGVKLSTQTIREYPYGKATSHMLGYLQKVNAEDLEKHKGEGYDENSYIGRSGIEAAYEKQLKGSHGVGIYIVDENGSTVDTIAEKQKEDGQTIELTIDIKLQQDLYEAFQNDKSASVALNPKTGEVLALVSTPTFSSNDFILGLSTEKWNALNDDKNQPLYNRFKATVVPGSSMKPITAAIGLDSGALDSSKDMNAQMKWQKDSSWGSYYVTTLHAPNPNTLKNALIESDNVYFAKAALAIGKDNLKNGYQKLKIGEEIPFELSLTKSQYASNDYSDEIQIADSGYGQGQMLMNPVQLSSIYTAFVNDGNIMTPHIVKSTKQSVWIKEAFTQKTCQEIKEALIGVVESGTGKAMKMEGVTLAGKTGTAEIKASQSDTTGTEMGWFTVMADTSKPIVITTMVEDVKNRGGSSYVVKNMKSSLSHYLK